MAGSDFVVCGICDLRGYSLKAHVKREHGLTKKQYEDDYGPAVCQSTKQRYSNSANYDWINRAKSEGRDLSEWKQKLSVGITAGVMASPTAREARRQNLTRLNQTAEFRAKSSETAIRTSAREDVQRARSHNLDRWRKNYPDVFMTRCFQRMLTVKSTRPEKILYQEVCRMFPAVFKHNQLIARRGKFVSTKTNVRQVDIYSRDQKIIIEFDGPFHFKPIQGEAILAHVRVKDNELNTVMTSEGALVIRVSYDMFKRGKFSEDTLAQIESLVSNNARGLYHIGSLYNG